MSSSSSPDLLPVLSRGKHRNPTARACFMELASFLAGERWSDHPACTHPLLAEVARNVNDRTSDADRPLLATLIPSVVGLTTDDVRADARIALRCALVALPVAPQSRQRSLAVAVQACLRSAAALGDADAGGLRDEAQQVLAQVPDAARWAEAFAARSGLDGQEPSWQRFRRSSGPGSSTSRPARSPRRPSRRRTGCCARPWRARSRSAGTCSRSPRHDPSTRAASGRRGRSRAEGSQ
jgi:hypothetical protein